MHLVNYSTTIYLDNIQNTVHTNLLAMESNQNMMRNALILLLENLFIRIEDYEKIINDLMDAHKSRSEAVSRNSSFLEKIKLETEEAVFAKLKESKTQQEFFGKCHKMLSKLKKNPEEQESASLLTWFSSNRERLTKFSSRLTTREYPDKGKMIETLAGLLQLPNDTLHYKIESIRFLKSEINSFQEKLKKSQNAPPLSEMEIFVQYEKFLMECHNHVLHYLKEDLPKLQSLADYDGEMASKAAAIVGISRLCISHYDLL